MTPETTKEKARRLADAEIAKAGCHPRSAHAVAIHVAVLKMLLANGNQL